MNWDAIAAVAELLGATGVILSLLYLATQLRQSNKLAKRNATQSLLAARGEFNRFIAGDPALTELYWKGMEMPDDLSDTEWKRFHEVSTTLIRHFEAIFLDQIEGLLPKGIWQSQDASMRRWMSKPGMQRCLIELEPDFDPGFVRHVLVDDRK